MQPARQLPCLVSPTPPSGCQAQGVNVSKIKYDDANKVNNNAIKQCSGMFQEMLGFYPDFQHYQRRTPSSSASHP
jgi:hypothetical protein